MAMVRTTSSPSVLGDLHNQVNAQLGIVDRQRIDVGHEVVRAEIGYRPTAPIT
ncbi:MAG: hypothetical protein MPW15_25690 [Candidatus Manganitrophus sp.]|nr:hypothetical protein [Candidatus Manganitrophus sp.]